MKNKDIIHVYPDHVPLNVLVPKRERARLKRERLLPEVLMSPYVIREVSLLYGISTHEQRVVDCLFSGRLLET